MTGITPTFLALFAALESVPDDVKATSRNPSGNTTALFRKTPMVAPHAWCGNKKGVGGHVGMQRIVAEKQIEAAGLRAIDALCLAMPFAACMALGWHLTASADGKLSLSFTMGLGDTSNPTNATFLGTATAIARDTERFALWGAGLRPGARTFQIGSRTNKTAITANTPEEALLAWALFKAPRSQPTAQRLAAIKAQVWETFPNADLARLAQTEGLLA